MDYSRYEIYDFDNLSAFNMSTGWKERSYKTHWHSYGEILVVGPGKPNKYSIERNIYDLSEGDIVIVWPTKMHGIIDADRAKALVIQFSNNFINSLHDLRRIMNLYRNLHIIKKSAHPELAEKLLAYTDRMKETFFAEDPTNREIQCCMLLMEFMLTLEEYKGELISDIDEEEKLNINADVTKRMVMVTDYIKNNLTSDDLSQAAMAEMAGISRDYFSRIFKNVTGLNYNKWMNTIRLEKACELLSEDGRTLTEVAMLSGFKSIPSFNRVFREEKGMSPGEYRTLFAGNVKQDPDNKI
ncbi:MAG: AraC family transcriptional regulator [Lachnospiraceae bacterium]|nr:AraC family transcriptional regulator [Lachnospiraceae bacterium]